MCDRSFHGKCENVDLRGFHKKSNWKCKSFVGEIRIDNVNRGEKSTKRVRIDDPLINNNAIDLISATLNEMLQQMNKLNHKIDLLLVENSKLKEEIAILKGANTESSSYSNAVKNTDSVLVVKQKGTQSDIKQVKENIKSKVKPADIGVTMGRATKNGDLIINCGPEKQIENVQTELQKNWVKTITWNFLKHSSTVLKLWV